MGADSRVDAETGACPEGKVKCSQATDKERTVCAESQAQCPNTSIILLDDTQAANLAAGYTAIQSKVQDRTLAFTKTAENKFPVGELRVDGAQPC